MLDDDEAQSIKNQVKEKKCKSDFLDSALSIAANWLDMKKRVN